MSIIKVPQSLTREATVTREGEGAEAKVRISISSDVPYLRYDYWEDKEFYEVLDHAPGGFNDSRLRAGIPMLFNHLRGSHLGRARKFESDGHRITVEDIVWSDSDEAKEKKADFEKGVLVDTSVGYSLRGEGEPVGTKDGIPIYRFQWEPHEFSLVTIPADITVGAGRERGHKPEGEPKQITIKDKKDLANNDKPEQEEHKQATNMRNTSLSRQFNEAEKDAGTGGGKVEVNVERERENAAQQALQNFETRCENIDKWIAALPKEGWRAAATEVAKDFKKVSDKRSFDEFRTIALEKCEKALAADTPQDNSELGLTKTERRQFSMRKAIYEIAMKKRGIGKGLTGHELAVCDAAEKQLGQADGREFVGLCIPDDMLRANFAEDNDLGTPAMRSLAGEVMQLRALMGRALNASTFTAGGALVGTELLGGSMIDILRNATLIGQGPMAITELSGLVGNIAIPKQTGTSSVYWLAEGAAITASQQSFAQLNLSPKRLGVATSYTKQLLAQASLSVEAFVRSDQALTMAVEEDRVGFLGTGVNGEPIGIFNTTGVLANVTFGGAATWADLIALEYGLENANVRTGQMTMVTSPLTKSYLKQTLVVAGSTFPIFLWGKNEGFPTINGVMPGVANDYPAYATKNVTTNQVVLGVFRNFVKARWAGFDVVVDPYTGALSELITIIVNSWLDIGLRYPQSFNVSTDAPAAP